MGSGISRCLRRERQPIPVEDIQDEMDNYQRPPPVVVQKNPVPPVENKQRADNFVEETYEPQIEAFLQQAPVDADQLISEGRIKELMDAIMADAEIRCRQEPVNLN